MGFVCRFDDGGKSFRPLCLYQVGSQLQWRWEAWSTPRPLYGLDRLSTNKSVVVVTEGEKAADAAQTLLPDHSCICSPNGANGAPKADWSALKGRDVVIWPDADEAGQSYATSVLKLAKKAGAKTIRTLKPPDCVPEGWDAADALEEGWNKEKAYSFLEEEGGGSLSTKVRKKGSGSPLLVYMGEAKLWLTPEKQVYATVHVNGRSENWSIESNNFQSWLVGKYYSDTGLAPNSQQLSDALRVFAAEAIKTGRTYTPALRVAYFEGVAYLDLADAERNIIKIDRGIWELVEQAPVKFIRPSTMLPLPIPEAGESVERARHLFNVGDADFKLLVGWLMRVLWGGSTNYPLLVLGGEQGSGKSSMARLIRSIIDPCRVPSTSLPRDERDTVVLALNSHVLNFDNVSRVDPSMSDVLCRLSTGGGFTTRRLHTDGELFSFYGVRPTVLNGITNLTEKADLAERSLTITMKRIEGAGRLTDQALNAEWERLAPEFLGALLTGIARAMSEFDYVELPELPRMADFVKFCVAASKGMDWEEGEFLDAYNRNQQQTTESVFEGDPVAVAIHTMMTTEGVAKTWTGTATNLLQELNLITSEDTKRSYSWPKTANAFGNALKRVVPLLRKKGIDVERHNTGQARLIVLLLRSE